MIAFRFEPGPCLLSVPVTLWGPRRSPSDLVFVLDTGTERTIVDLEIASRLGFSERDSTRRSRVVSALGAEEGFLVTAPRILALGWDRDGFPIADHRLGANARIDGLIGADFFAGLRLVIDYGAGVVEVSESSESPSQAPP
ncbi:MAG: retropepsin-like domain-containing protein [Deltaproteobacteria bacterium]|nr:retropepsin-like domain-containing protein [Deltaproteobacteria bacterium]